MFLLPFETFTKIHPFKEQEDFFIPQFWHHQHDLTRCNLSGCLMLIPKLVTGSVLPISSDCFPDSFPILRHFSSLLMLVSIISCHCLHHLLIICHPECLGQTPLWLLMTAPKREVIGPHLDEAPGSLQINWWQGGLPLPYPLLLSIGSTHHCSCTRAHCLQTHTVWQFILLP